VRRSREGLVYPVKRDASPRTEIEVVAEGTRVQPRLDEANVGAVLRQEVPDRGRPGDRELTRHRAERGQEPDEPEERVVVHGEVVLDMDLLEAVRAFGLAEGDPGDRPARTMRDVAKVRRAAERVDPPPEIRSAIHAAVEGARVGGVDARDRLVIGRRDRDPRPVAFPDVAEGVERHRSHHVGPRDLVTRTAVERACRRVERRGRDPALTKGTEPRGEHGPPHADPARLGRHGDPREAEEGHRAAARVDAHGHLDEPAHHDLVANEDTDVLSLGARPPELDLLTRLDREGCAVNGREDFVVGRREREECVHVARCFQIRAPASRPRASSAKVALMVDLRALARRVREARADRAKERQLHYQEVKAQKLEDVEAITRELEEYAAHVRHTIERRRRRSACGRRQCCEDLARDVAVCGDGAERNALQSFNPTGGHVVPEPVFA
jgi:hypothetical protein